MDKIFYPKSGLSNEKAAPGISSMNFPKNKSEYKNEKRPWNMLASYRTLLSDLTSFFLFHTNMACHNFAVGSFQIRGLLGVFFLTVTFQKKKKNCLFQCSGKKKLVTQPNSSSACVCKKWSETIIKCGGELFASNSMNMFSQFLIDGYVPPGK